MSRNLPPMMGFEQEEIVPSNPHWTTHYTCVNNGHRVFVWWAGECWGFEVHSDVNAAFGTSAGVHFSPIEKDALLLCALIHRYTGTELPSEVTPTENTHAEE